MIWPRHPTSIAHQIKECLWRVAEKCICKMANGTLLRTWTLIVVQCDKEPAPTSRSMSAEVTVIRIFVTASETSEGDTKSY